jgi:hypothetical protein
MSYQFRHDDVLRYFARRGGLRVSRSGFAVRTQSDS